MHSRYIFVHSVTDVGIWYRYGSVKEVNKARNTDHLPTFLSLFLLVTSAPRLSDMYFLTATGCVANLK